MEADCEKRCRFSQLLMRTLGCTQSVRDQLERTIMQLKKSILPLADLVFSLFCVLLLFPLLFLIALLVKASSPGPVFYKQIRVSANGRKFTTIKFRTMYVCAEPKAREEATKDFYLTDDPQVTAIGSFLRRTNLDELPRFYNVLSGETSLFSMNKKGVKSPIDVWCNL